MKFVVVVARPSTTGETPVPRHGGIVLAHSRRPRISVVVPALNEGDNLRWTVENLRDTLPDDSEIVVVDDGSTDGCADHLPADGLPLRLIRVARQGLAAAKNLGASEARGDFLVFADAHVKAQPGWWKPLVDALHDPAVGAVGTVVSVMGDEQNKGYGMRWTGPDLDIEWLALQASQPHPVCIVPGCLVAMGREVFLATGGFDNGMVRWGMEDSELSLRLWLLGYQQLLVPEVDIAHLFRPRHPYAIDWTCIIHNKLRMAFCHFKAERISRVVEALKGNGDFAQALSLAVESNVWASRQDFHGRRSFCDDWFFERFGMNF